MPGNMLVDFAFGGLESLDDETPVLWKLLECGRQRQANALMAVAASRVADPSVLVCEGTAVSNVASEGYYRGELPRGLCGELPLRA